MQSEQTEGNARARFWQIFAFGMCVSLIAMGMVAFSLGYTADDFARMERVPTWRFNTDLSSFFMSQGRWGYVLLERMLLDFGALPWLSPVLGAFTLMAVYSGLAAGLCRFWRIESDLILCLLIAGLVTVHPYQVELFTFRCASMTLALGYIPGFAALLLSRMNPRSFLWTVPFLVFSISCYQSVLNYAGVCILVGLLIEWHRCTLASTDDEKRTIWRVVQDRYWAAILTVAMAIVSYLILNKIILASTGIGAEDRSAFVRPGEILARISTICTMLSDILTKPEPILPVGTKAFLLLLLGAATLIVLWSTFRKLISLGSLSDKILAAVGLPLLICGLLSVIGVLIPLQTTWAAPRAFGHIGIFWSGTLTISWLAAGPLGKRLATGLCAILIFSFCGICNHVILDQQRVNQRDLIMASRIINRLEQNPDFSRAESLVVLGGSDDFRDKAGTDYAGINPSAFFADWSKSAVIYEAYGRGFRPAFAEELAVADEYYKTAPRWPALGSAVVIDKMALVCLP